MMQIIFLDQKRGRNRHWQMSVPALVAVFAAVVGLSIALGAASFWALYQWNAPDYGHSVVTRWQAQLQQDQSEFDKVQRESANGLHALTVKLADMQAQLLRIDALGERLAAVANLDDDEFDFNAEPALGGPDSDEGAVMEYRPPAFDEAVKQLSDTLERRQQQLTILDGLLQHKNLVKATKLAGRPVDRGWISSPYGYRADPFVGSLHKHNGIDFAAKEGTQIHATAAGVVTWSGPRTGYGNMVEVNHGNGIRTRYAHAAKVLVKPGDIVDAGDDIALVGSTGRSTGPHVHYEVWKNGVRVNPQPYLR